MKKWKIWLGLVLVFVSGVAVGSVCSAVLIHDKVLGIARSGPDAISDIATKKLARRLNLDDKQKLAVHEALRDTQFRMMTVAEKSQPEIEQIFNDGQEMIKQVLDERQKAQFEQMYHDFRKFGHRRRHWLGRMFMEGRYGKRPQHQ